MTPTSTSRCFQIVCLALSLLTSACCTKKKCDTNTFAQVELIGFSETERDTVILRRYEPGGGALIDSLFSTDGGTILTLGNFTRNSGGGFQESDYQIEVPAVDHTYRITGFEMRSEGCNTCFPWRPKGDYYQVLNAYELDGQRKAGYIVQIDR